MRILWLVCFSDATNKVGMITETRIERNRKEKYFVCILKINFISYFPSQSLVLISFPSLHFVFDMICSLWEQKYFSMELQWYYIPLQTYNSVLSVIVMHWSRNMVPYSRQKYLIFGVWYYFNATLSPLSDIV